VEWSMGVSVLSVTNVLNIKAEEIMKFAYKYTLTAGQRMRIGNYYKASSSYKTNLDD
jgi:hypothetical protein